jgi:hypothetical protein
MTPRIFVASVLTLLGIAIAGASLTNADGSTDGVPDPVATQSGFVCPSGSNPYDFHLWIHVTKWCIVPGVRKQSQVKVQMKIHNKSQEHSLDVSQDTIRLIVHEFDPDKWSPAHIGSPTLDRPVQVTYRGKSVWAIPANAEDAYDTLPHQPGVLTFATHWGISKLVPGGTLDPAYHYGDLVFYMPAPRHHSGGRENIVGVAYVKGTDIIALCPPDTWGLHVPAASF